MFRLAAEKKIKQINLETLHDGKKLVVHNLKNSLINDYDQMPRIMNKHWGDNIKNKKKKSFMLRNFIEM